MKVPSSFYSTRVVIDIETLEVLERDIVPYSGPWELVEGAPADTAPADAAPADVGGGDAPPADGGGESLDDWANNAPADAPADGTPAEGDQPPVEGDQPPAEGDDATPPADPNAPPAKPATPQELAADTTLKKAYRENFGKV